MTFGPSRGLTAMSMAATGQTAGVVFECVPCLTGQKKPGEGAFNEKDKHFGQTNFFQFYPGYYRGFDCERQFDWSK